MRRDRRGQIGVMMAPLPYRILLNERSVIGAAKSARKGCGDSGRRVPISSGPGLVYADGNLPSAYFSRDIEANRRALSCSGRSLFISAARRVLGSPPTTWSRPANSPSSPRRATSRGSFFVELSPNAVFCIPARAWNSVAVAPGRSAVTFTLCSRSYAPRDGCTRIPGERNFTMPSTKTLPA